jgi:hypothetical protein
LPKTPGKPVVTDELRCKGMTKYDGALLRCERIMGHQLKHTFFGSDCVVEWEDGEKPTSRTYCELADCTGH